MEYDHPVSMADALKRLMEDPELLANCRAGALRTVEKKFEIHKLAEATYQVYETACRETR